MKRSLLSLLARAAALSALVALAGCGVLGGKDTDETQGWSAQKLYGEAKDAMNGKTWDKAIKYLEKLEARYPYGRFAQQAQLDVAYAYWKQGERASAIARMISSCRKSMRSAYMRRAHGLKPVDARSAHDR